MFIHRRLNADGSAVGPSTLNILPSDSITYDDEPQPASDAYGSKGSDDVGFGCVWCDFLLIML